MCARSFHNLFSYSIELNYKLILFILLFISITFVNCQRNCGNTCIPIKQCKSVIKYIEESPRPLPASVVSFLRSIQCGLGSDGPSVCCTDGSPTTAKPIDIGNSDVVDISKHRNLKLILSRTCGPIVLTDKLSGANSTQLSQFPWMALLQYETSSGLEFWCGGSLISDRYVLTAAHCVSNLYRSTVVSVRLGEHDINSDVDCQTIEDTMYCAEPVQDISVEKVIIHPQYNKVRMINDIALIRLSRKADLSPENVRTVCLPITAELQTAPLKNLKTTGWGTTENQSTSNILLQADVPFVSIADCQKKFGNRVQLGNSQMCAGGKKGVDTCKGDSGGPLVYPGKLLGPKFIQYGIVSFGVGKCSLETMNPGVYTKVAYFLKWILDELEQ